ncbi:MAG TPA: Ig-like domain-containing protein, partial [Beijerinckiaceae bacterium]
MATLVVTTNADSGAGSLREAIASANASPGSRIEFDPAFFTGGASNTITLASGLPKISAGVTIDGTTSDGSGITINGADGATAPAHGSVTVNADGTFTYTPDANFDGTDTFSYTLTDANNDASEATVTMTVPASTQPPAGPTPTPGNDSLVYGDGDDRVDALAGDDRVLGNGGNDVIEGNTGDDRLDGGDGNDRLSGGDGDDRLLGQAGNDRLDG